MIQIPTTRLDLGVSRLFPHKEKVVIILGATGTEISRLSIDLATHFPAEIINFDKMQVYHGLDIVTKKITEEECCGVPHHLLGIVDPESEFSAENFVDAASITLKSVVQRGKLPIITGGMNSFIEALVDDQSYEYRSGHKFRSRYEVCFLWVDIAMHALDQFVSERVDHMVAAGMVEELRNMYHANADYSKGIRRAIGVQEFDSYFQAEFSSSTDQKTRVKLLETAINETKINTSMLGRRQIEKINQLKNVKGWQIQQFDATKVFQEKGRDGNKAAWEEMVAGPALQRVCEFLFGFGHHQDFAAAALTKKCETGRDGMVSAAAYEASI